MQMTKNGIPVDNPRQRKKVSKIQTTKKLQNDFTRYKKFATMTGFENGCYVTATVPMAHPEFKEMLSQGYRVIDVWSRRDSA